MSCAHVAPRAAAPQAQVCQACGTVGQLRVCDACGYTGCADSHEGHATAHASEEGHPVLREHPGGPDAWAWCATCGDYVL